MSTDQPEVRKRRRVVVVHGAGGHEPAALEAAALLAARIGTELAGLFVEDPDLLTMADLPVTALLSYRGAERAALDPALMRRSLRVQAQRFRHRLAALSESRNLAWSFEVRQGHVAETVLSGATAEDWVVLGTSVSATVVRPAPPAPQSMCTALLLVRHGMRGPHRVAVLQEDSDETLALGESLALHLHAPLTVVPLEMPDTDETDRMKRLAAWAAERKDFAGVTEPCRIGLADVQSAADGAAADLIVMACGGRLSTEIGPARLERALGGGSLVVAAAKPRPAPAPAPGG